MNMSSEPAQHWDEHSSRIRGPRAHGRRGASLVEALIALSVVCLGVLAAAQRLHVSEDAAAQRVGVRIASLSGGAAAAQGGSPPSASEAQHAVGRPAEAAPPPSVHAEPPADASPSLLDRAKGALGWAFNRGKSSVEEQLQQARDEAKTIQGASDWAKNRLNDVEDLQTSVDDALEQRADAVPGLRPALTPLLDLGEQQLERSVGATKSVINLGTGVGVMAADPVDSAYGLYDLAAHVPSPTGVNGLKVAQSAVRTATGRAEDGELGRALDPRTASDGDLQFLWDRVRAPYQNGVDRGKYDEVGAQATTDVALLLFGGELMPAGAAGEAAGLSAEAASTTGELAASGARGAELAAGGGELAEGANAAAHGGEVGEAQSAAVAHPPEPALDGSGKAPADAPGHAAPDGIPDAPPGEAGNLPWTSWSEYPKVMYEGREYAQIGDRIYTHHAVDRMQPSGLGAPAGSVGSGRSIAPNFIEDVIRNGDAQTVDVNGVHRTVYTSGTVEVVTEEEGRIIVTVNPFKRTP